MQDDSRNIIYLITRYALALIFGINSLYLFYFFLTPATVYTSYIILKFLFDAILISQNVIFFKGFYAAIIPACIGGSAYYLLLVLNLATPMKLNIRIKSIVFLLLFFFILNILRISLFSFILYEGYQFFDLAHKLTWYLGSTLMVIFIWFFNVKLFRINSIPFHTDVKYILSLIKSNKT